MSKKSKESNKSKSSDDKEIDYDDIYDGLIDLYYQQKYILYSHQHDSFNEFIDKIFPDILTNSDNYFYEKILENKIIKYRFKMENIKYKLPTIEETDEPMYPIDARTTHSTYSMKAFATVTQYQDIIDVITGEKITTMIGKTEDNIPVAKIPVMVKSKYCNLVQRPDEKKLECPLDPGGYFIIGGSEKVMMSVENMAHRKPMVSKKKEQANEVYRLQIDSKAYDNFVGNNQMMNLEIKKDFNVIMEVPQLKDVSVYVVIKALGIENEEDIIDLIVYDKTDVSLYNMVKKSINSQNQVVRLSSQKEALEYLSSYIKPMKFYPDVDPEIKKLQKEKHLMKILSKDMLPHCILESKIKSPELSMKHKAYYIGYMLNKLFSVRVGRIPPDSRDWFTNKRLITTGILLGQLAVQFTKKMLSECSKYFNEKNKGDSQPTNIIVRIKPSTVEQGIKTALMTGQVGSGTKNRKGLAQLLHRLTFIQTATSLRKVITPGMDASNNKMVSPRLYDNTQFGMFCPLETLEGAKTGLVKSLSMMANITLNLNYQNMIIIQDFLDEELTKLDEINLKDIHLYGKVLLNGNWIGLSKDILRLSHSLKEMRMKGKIDKTVGIVLDLLRRELRINTDSGRLYRPLLRVDSNGDLILKKHHIDQIKNGKIKSWNHFMEEYPDVVEYVDIEESQHIMLADYLQTLRNNKKVMNRTPIINKKMEKINRYDENVFVRYTHCELHPSLILGAASSNIPFPNHNQGPRCIYQFSQMKQAMGLNTTDFRHRADITYVLYHPQIPIVLNRNAKYTGTTNIPAGCNIIVAIMSWKGFNQEDSIMINKSAVDRGLFRVISYKKYTEKQNKNPSTIHSEKFTKPDPNIVTGMKDPKDTNYEKLNLMGFIPKETPIVNGDVLIGKIVPVLIKQNKKTKPFKDESIILKSNIPGTVDEVYHGSTDGIEYIKMRIRFDRIPKIGDKFCLIGDHEVLTMRGWIKIPKLTVDDLVASLVDDKLTYSNPLSVFNFEYDGPIYNLRSPHVDVSCTIDHQLYVKKDKTFELVEASKVYDQKVFYKKSAKNPRPFMETFTTETAPHFTLNTNAFLTFLASFMVDRLSLGHYPQVAQYLSEYNLSDISKHLPKMVLELGKEQSLYLLDLLTFGENKFLTKSKTLVDQLMILVLNCEKSATLIQDQDYYGLEICDSEPLVTPENVEIVEYIGKVYCMEIQSHVFMTRLNGKNCWIGNCNRSGQKSTAALLIPEAELPFTKDGLVPDIIMNPNAFLKRRTIGQLLEGAFAKLAIYNGTTCDATPFNDIDIDRINRELKKKGVKEYGKETLYNGITGEQIEADIYFAPNYYQRLKHMVDDKIHARGVRGSVQSLNRQPNEGTRLFLSHRHRAY